MNHVSRRAKAMEVRRNAICGGKRVNLGMVPAKLTESDVLV